MAYKIFKQSLPYTFCFRKLIAIYDDYLSESTLCWTFFNVTERIGEVTRFYFCFHGGDHIYIYKIYIPHWGTCLERLFWTFKMAFIFILFFFFVSKIKVAQGEMVLVPIFNLTCSYMGRWCGQYHAWWLSFSWSQYKYLYLWPCDWGCHWAAFKPQTLAMRDSDTSLLLLVCPKFSRKLIIGTYLNLSLFNSARAKG